MDGTDSADKLLSRIEIAFSMLANYPELGPARPDLAPSLRDHVVRKHLIRYRLVADGVEVVRVVHGSRQLSGLHLE